MIDVIRHFHERVGEIDLYCVHVEKIINKRAQLLYVDGSKENISNELAQILRANAFLLFYNLIESSMALAIEQIHLAIVTSGVDFDAVDSKIKREIFKYIKKDVSVDTFMSGISNIVIDIVKFYPANNKMFSGNVDAQKIRDMGDRYGFSCTTDISKTRDGANLVNVKEKRNHLAHGFISFQECGKDYTVEDIIQLKDEVINYIKDILDNIELFINSKSYLSIP